MFKDLLQGLEELKDLELEEMEMPEDEPLKEDGHIFPRRFTGNLAKTMRDSGQPGLLMFLNGNKVPPGKLKDTSKLVFVREATSQNFSLPEEGEAVLGPIAAMCLITDIHDLSPSRWSNRNIDAALEKQEDEGWIVVLNELFTCFDEELDSLGPFSMNDSSHRDGIRSLEFQRHDRADQSNHFTLSWGEDGRTTFSWKFPNEKYRRLLAEMTYIV